VQDVPREDPKFNCSRASLTIGRDGMSSVYRGLNGVPRQYGPWFASMQNDDKAAIVASGRMYKIDDWAGATGQQQFGHTGNYVTVCHCLLASSVSRKPLPIHCLQASSGTQW